MGYEKEKGRVIMFFAGLMAGLTFQEAETLCKIEIESAKLRAFLV